MGRQLLVRVVAAVVLLAGVNGTAVAANKDHQQMMADIRMLQEQAQQLQQQLAALTEVMRSVSAKLDDQAGASRKAFADQKLLVDTIANDLRVVREKVDDNNVRISSLSQELEAIRMAAPGSAGTVPAVPPAGGEGQAPGAGTPPSGAPGSQPAQPVNPGMSPQRLYDMAWADYAGGQYQLAIQGFDGYIKTFPKSEQAGQAQFYIGESYYQQGKFTDAVAAYDRVISDYPNSRSTPEAYYKRGLALNALGQTDRARASWEYLVKTFPNSDAGRLARQRLEQLSRRDED